MGRELSGEGQVVEPGDAEDGLVNSVAFESAVPEDLPVLQPREGVFQPCHPQLLDVGGVGPDSAAALLIAAGDNPERLASEASFAALCGVSPVEQSSGKTQRRRLNRGGNRQANAALYRIVVTRLRRDARTRLYLERRTKQGMSKREIIRCLKRYVAREIYRQIQPASALAAASSSAA
jgi:transposase